MQEYGYNTKGAKKFKTGIQIMEDSDEEDQGAADPFENNNNVTTSSNFKPKKVSNVGKHSYFMLELVFVNRII